MGRARNAPVIIEEIDISSPVFRSPYSQLSCRGSFFPPPRVPGSRSTGRSSRPSPCASPVFCKHSRHCDVTQPHCCAHEHRPVGLPGCGWVKQRLSVRRVQACASSGGLRWSCCSWGCGSGCDQTEEDSLPEDQFGSEADEQPRGEEDEGDPSGGIGQRREQNVRYGLQYPAGVDWRQKGTMID
jgi:hypothetical protein